MSWKLYEGDCFDYLPLIEDKSVDMILCDLPYGITACKWDTPLPLDELWFEYKRVIKDNGAIVLTASQPFTTRLISSNYDMFRYEWIWEKTVATGFLDARRKPMKSHENILIFSIKQTCYSPQMEKGTPYIIKRGPCNDSITKDKSIQKGGFVSINDGERFPKTIIKIKNETGLHPTQKPVALFEYLIKTYTNEGDLVLDNCAGSGTTGVACQNLGRNCILMEKEKEYCNIIKDRMNETAELIVEKRKQKGLDDFF